MSEQKQKPDFIETSVASFRDGLTSTLAEFSDTFAFDFLLSDIPDWQKRIDVKIGGLKAGTPMSIVALIRTKAAADTILEGMKQLRDAALTEMEKAGKR
jgi:hypothetical protein